jgi:hypothetical protein
LNSRDDVFEHVAVLAACFRVKRVGQQFRVLHDVANVTNRLRWHMQPTYLSSPAT